MLLFFYYYYYRTVVIFNNKLNKTAHKIVVTISAKSFTQNLFPGSQYQEKQLFHCSASHTIATQSIMASKKCHKCKHGYLLIRKIAVRVFFTGRGFLLFCFVLFSSVTEHSLLFKSVLLTAFCSLIGVK